MPVLPAGYPAPRFELPDVDGRLCHLDELLTTGPVCLYFFKTECPTSALTLPLMQRLQELYPEARVAALSQDPPTVALPFAQELGVVRLRQLVDDAPYPVSRSYGIRFTPTVFLLTPGGRVDMVVEAWTRDGYNELARRIAKRLGVDGEPLSVEGDGLPPGRAG